MMKLIKYILIAFTLSIFFSIRAYAVVINATSCSQQDVQEAVNSTTTGDIVIVPSDKCTWSTGVNFPKDKKILLEGAGMDLTIITLDPAGTVLRLFSSGSRVTGIGFINGTIQVTGDNWRIDNCKFSSDSFRMGVEVFGTIKDSHPTGLVDHCVFINNKVQVTGWWGLLSHDLWAQPLNLGSGDNIVFVEDCSFTGLVHSNSVDGNYGSKYVFRYNTVNDSYVEAHSIQTGTSRAARQWEVYNNIFNQVNRAMYAPAMVRGGTGVFFNNTLNGTWGTAGFALDNLRSCKSDKVMAMGWCDGNSPCDGNDPNKAAGYSCRDQIGRSTDQWLWTDEHPNPPQAINPAYAWNNKHRGNDFGFVSASCAESKAHIQTERDFFNGVQKPGYTPYTYPHPLIKTWDDRLSQLVAPENLRIEQITQ